MGASFLLPIFLIETDKLLKTKLAHDFQISPRFMGYRKSSIKPPGGLFISSSFEGG